MTTTPEPAGKSSPAGLPMTLWAILGAGFLLRLFLAFQSPQILVTLNMPDDAFYYFKIAQNIATGQGSTFDGIHSTNGYHPLWMGLLILIFRIVPGQPELALRLGLIEQALLDVVTGLMVYFLAQAILADRRWALLAGALYFLNPNTVLHEMNGMETPVTTLLTVVVLYCFLSVLAPLPGTKAPSARFAVASGLLLLARTDNVILCAVLFSALAWQEWKQHATLRRTLKIALAVFVIVAPWLAWNWAQFHQFVQVSGLARPWVNWQKTGALGMLLGLELFSYTITVHWAQLSCLSVGFFALWGIGWFILESTGAKPTAQEPGVYVLELGWLGIFLTLGFHSFLRLYPRLWYSAPFLVLSALSFAWAGRRISKLTGARWAVSLAIALIFAAYGVMGVRLVRARPLAWQAGTLEAARWLNAYTASSARTGSFNAGAIGFFSNRAVVNLDGVVNNSAFEALCSHRLEEYLTANSVEYVADFKYAAEVDYAEFWGRIPPQERLVPIAQFPSAVNPHDDNFVRVYRLLPRSRLPTPTSNAPAGPR